MPLELKPLNKLTYKLKLTPQMKLSMDLLQLPLLKLKEFVKQQVEENPLLEIDPHTNCNITEVKPTIGVGVEEPQQESYSSDDREKQNYKESLITKPITLQEHLLRQLRLLVNSDEDYKIGELIIGNINDNGYLRCPLEEIAESLQTTISKVKEVLLLIQTFDPIGVGARSLRECLLLQIDPHTNCNITKVKPTIGVGVVGQIVDKYLPFLEKRRFNYIAKKLKVSIEKIKEAMKEIANLNPKPGLAFNNERTNYLLPDAVVRKAKDSYEVIMNDWELPRISLNEKYKQMIKQKATPEDAKEYLKERLKSAKVLINAINQRKQTIQRVMEEIVYMQKDFLDNGETNFKPMTLEQIAKRLNKHKSTISRAMSNKYLQTPYGTFKLRSFLNYGVKQKNGELFSSKAVKSKIKDSIENENKEMPLTDQKIVEQLKDEGLSISRRTVAKYRAQLKILSSMSRRFI